MTMPVRRTQESVVNGFLAEALGRRLPRWTVEAEQTGVIRGDLALRPDVLLESEGGQPLIIESEVDPASQVEGDAKARLGLTLDQGGEAVEQVVALCLPGELANCAQSGLPVALGQVRYRYATLSLPMGADSENPVRWPAAGWLEGGIDDLAGLCEKVSLSEQTLAAGLGRLEEAVRDIAHRLRTLTPQEVLNQIATELCQEDGIQTSRMTAAIVLNAITFHTAIAGNHGIPTVEQLRDEYGRLKQSRVLRCWGDILEINYWPIFHVASGLLRPIPASVAMGVLGVAADAAEDLAGFGVTTMHDLAGRMFQRLIADRKFLATFYTLPASAAMVAEMATARLDVDWADEAAVAQMQVADLACGTGTLLSAAYEAIRSRYRRAGGDDADIHPQMIEQVLIAADVMPQAAHLTASMLSSAHPSIPFGNTRVHTLPYGVDHQQVRVGSLELLGIDALASLFPTGEQQAHGEGRQGLMTLRRESVDMVIMNPPFTRPTNHESTTVPRPDFAGMDNDRQTQKLMGARLKGLREGLRRTAPGHGPPILVGNGNAGLASYFVDLAHLKLKNGGVLALVLPFSAVTGGSWGKLTELLAAHYTDVSVVSLATTGSTDRAFSADTGMADTVIVATKNTQHGSGDALFVNLRHRPESLPEAAEAARLSINMSEDTPTGSLMIGNDRVGTWIRGSLTESAGAAGLYEPGIATTMDALRCGSLALPRIREQHSVAMTTLGQIGERGPVDRDIGFKPGAGGDRRGPFVVHPLDGREHPDYPALWNHSAKRERFLVVNPDHRGEIRGSYSEKAQAIWDTSTRLHFNRDFQINSQSLAACLTESPSLGGTAWPSFQPGDPNWEFPLLLWANTTLGLMCFWWVGTRQQQGRARITITALPYLPVLDPRTLTAQQIKTAERIFYEFLHRRLLPANEAYHDQTRKDLDRAVLVDLLHLPDGILDSLDVRRRQWCAEPSVHGGKATRP